MPSHPEVISPSYRLSSISSLSEDRALSVKRYGILSQTISPGTQIRWILPARIRSRKHNDVIFVGTTSIQLRECLPDGTLLDATAKLHIGTQILAAKVISAKLEKIATVDAVLRQEWDEEQFLIKGEPCRDQQPPQILALCTAVGELIYVYAVTDNDSSVRFVYAKRNIVQGLSMLSKWGRHMAIDPGSKLLALATSDVLSVFSLQDVDDIKIVIDSSDQSQSNPRQLNKEQRFLPVDGVILQMDFLRSPDDEEERTFLLLIVAKEGKTKILLYRWNCRESLVFMEPMRCSGQILPVEDSMPLMLIPSSRPLSFWIVTEAEMVFYENILSKTAKRLSTPLNPDTNESASYLWAQWAKPVRHGQYEKDKEDVLLIREDGMTRFFSRTHTPPSNAVIAITPGFLNIRIDTAVCMLPGPRVRGGDILVLGGIDTDGGVFWLPPRDFPMMLQTIPNISPLHGVIALSEQNEADLNSHHRRQKIFSISGNLSGSRINELRFGFEAQSLASIPIDGCPALDRLWVHEQERYHQLFFVASNLERTLVIAQSLVIADEMQLIEDQSQCALLLNEPSLALEKLSSGSIVQMTPSGIYISQSSVIGNSPKQIHLLENCVVADIDSSSGLFVAACVSSSSESYVTCGMIQEWPEKLDIVTAPTILNTKRPFSMRLVSILDFHILVLGFFDGSLQFHTISSSEGIRLRANVEGSGEKGVGISAVDILHKPGTDSALVLTGTLSGQLVLSILSIDVDGEQPSYTIEPCGAYHMGLSRVSITRDLRHDDDKYDCFISGDERLAKVKLISKEQHLAFTFDEIWVTDRANTSIPQPSLRAIVRVPELKSSVGAEWSHNVLFGASEQIISTNLIEQRQTIPLCYANCGQAKHFAYSAFLDKIVVASDSTLQEDDSLLMQPAIYLIEPNLSDTQSPPEHPIKFGKNHETVKALINWSPTDGRTQYHLIVVALGDGRDTRLGHLSAKKLAESNDGTMSFKTVMSLSRTEVHAVCEFAPSSLVIAAGSQLLLLHLEVEAKKWSHQAKYDLPSAAFSLSVRGRYVYAATTSHSMMVFKLEDQQFKPVFADKSAQSVRHVVPFGNDGRHVLISALDGTGTAIYGYMQGSSTSDNPSPSFEAQIPLPLDHVIPIRTHWPHGDQYAFQGSTVDGTIYHFKTLSFDECRMLHFLEKIARSDVSKPARKQVALLTKKMAQTWITKLEAEGTTIFDPRNMHVNGDVIERLVDESLERWRQLLGPGIKEEDKMNVDNSRTKWARFDMLAARVVGHNADQVVAVHVWARRLLRSSIV